MESPGTSGTGAGAAGGAVSSGTVSSGTVSRWIGLTLLATFAGWAAKGKYPTIWSLTSGGFAGVSVSVSDACSTGIAQVAMICFDQSLVSFGFRGRLRDRYFRG